MLTSQGRLILKEQYNQIPKQAGVERTLRLGILQTDALAPVGFTYKNLMQELDSFNGQESLNPVLMLKLGAGAIPIAVTLHSILLLPWTWCISATDASISDAGLPLVTMDQKNRFVTETRSQSHQKGQADVSPKDETSPSM